MYVEVAVQTGNLAWTVAPYISRHRALRTQESSPG